MVLSFVMSWTVVRLWFYIFHAIFLSFISPPPPKFSRAADIFDILTWHYSVTFTSFSFLRLSPCISHFCASRSLADSLSLSFQPPVVISITLYNQVLCNSVLELRHTTDCKILSSSCRLPNDLTLGHITYLFTYLLTTCSRVLFEELIGSQIV